MPSIDIEIDEYQLRDALSSTIDESRLGDNVDNIETTVNDIETTVNSVGEAVGRIEEGLGALDEIRASLDTFAKALNAPDKNVGRINEDGVFSGFRTGENVILINALHPEGIKGVVDPAAYSTVNWQNTVPVKRDDTGEFDIFPAQHVILASSVIYYLEHLKTLPEPEADTASRPDPEPHGDPIQWNLRVLQSAINDGTVVEFTYITPSPSYSAAGDTRKRRIFKPFFIERIGLDGNQSLVKGIDVDLEANRSFRVDRIEGYVRTYAPKSS